MATIIHLDHHVAEILTLKYYAYDVKGMSVSYLKPKWRDLLHHYITDECLYDLVFLYHIHLLMDFTSHKINFPYFLYNDQINLVLMLSTLIYRHMFVSIREIIFLIFFYILVARKQQSSQETQPPKEEQQGKKTVDAEYKVVDE